MFAYERVRVSSRLTDDEIAEYLSYLRARDVSEIVFPGPAVVSSILCKRFSASVESALPPPPPLCGNRCTPWWRRRGCTRGRQPSCGGSRQHRCVPALFAGAQRAPGVGGYPPAPAFPLGGNGKGGSNSLLPQANSAYPSRAGEMARNLSSCASSVLSGLTVQSGLDPLAPQHLEVVQRLLPVLDRVPLGDHIAQRQVQ